ncbi:hypothetical protein ACOKM5_44175 [Streptomyces sp. BH097]|uniref:hypothetical protein n=1 Tax=Streptomyces sp. BH097 TaxID=3410406 RepID=UPI003CF7D271
MTAGAATPAVFHGGTRADAGTGHEHTMRLAIEQARKNPRRPFGAVITATRTGDALASSANDTAGAPCCTAKWPP